MTGLALERRVAPFVQIRELVLVTGCARLVAAVLHGACHLLRDVGPPVGSMVAPGFRHEERTAENDRDDSHDEHESGANDVLRVLNRPVWSHGAPLFEESTFVEGSGSRPKSQPRKEIWVGASWRVGGGGCSGANSHRTRGACSRPGSTAGGAGSCSDRKSHWVKGTASGLDAAAGGAGSCSDRNSQYRKVPTRFNGEAIGPGDSDPAF